MEETNAPVSFFDEDDEPRRSPRPRRGGGAGADAAADRQTLLVRRGVALAAALLILILLVVAVRGCLSTQRENALRDYNREVASIGRESERGVGREFFRLLRERGNESAQDLQTAISGFRVQAEQQLEQAEGLSVPDEMVGAQRSLLLSLQFRRDGLEFIAERIRAALGDEGEASEEAVAQIAGQMQGFLTSDVLYRARVVPLIRAELDEAEIGGQRVPVSRFMQDLGWMDPSTTAERLGQPAGAGGTDAEEEAEPGLHGTGIDAVLVGDTTLVQGEPNLITLPDDLTFIVRFTNQGEYDETDVGVTLTVEGEGQPIVAETTIDVIRQGATADASLRLPRRPAADQPVTIVAEVEAVPGEELTENNRVEYEAGFATP